MAVSIRASQARAFIQRCRQQPSPPSTTVLRASSTSSQYSPSNFGKAFIPPSAASTATSATPSSEVTAPWDRPLRAPNLYHHPSARSRPIPPINAKFTFTNWLRSLFGLRISSPASSAKPPFSIHNNPYRARKSWPPDFARLHSKQQFHFEKTYRRRAALKWARPSWTRWVKLIQHTLVVTITIYFVFICAPDEGTPFDGFRVWFFAKMRTLTGLGQAAREEAERLEVEMKRIREERIRKQKGEKNLLEETNA